ncbi:hypothetical protein [Acinetobacter pittii]|uniref:hypothetical protein n=1 Tax=Acinetobacter pittii TaxID=48296 RepID=UPI000D353D28|nr:hypothetical protein [Acinetobacter pittii]PTV49434.1 hypothetical protein DBL01_07200 [Acinetobacter pittii]
MNLSLKIKKLNLKINTHQIPCPINVNKATVASKPVGGKPIVETIKFLTKAFANHTTNNWHKNKKGFK